MEDIHPPHVVTLSRINAELDTVETTSPLPSAPSSPRGSPSASARSPLSGNGGIIEGHEDGDDKGKLHSPPQHRYPQQYQNQQSLRPQPLLLSGTDKSFQDDAEQDESAHVHPPTTSSSFSPPKEDEYEPFFTLRDSLLTIQKSNDSFNNDRDNDNLPYGRDRRETPFDEEPLGPDGDGRDSTNKFRTILGGEDEEEEVQNDGMGYLQSSTGTNRIHVQPIGASVPEQRQQRRHYDGPPQDLEEDMSFEMGEPPGTVISHFELRTPNPTVKSPPPLVKKITTLEWELPVPINETNINHREEPIAADVTQAKLESSESPTSTSKSLSPPVPPSLDEDPDPELTTASQDRSTTNRSGSSRSRSRSIDSLPKPWIMPPPVSPAEKKDSSSIHYDDDDDEYNTDDDDVQALTSTKTKTRPQTSAYLPKPSALRSTSAPVHALYQTDPRNNTTTSGMTTMPRPQGLSSSNHTRHESEDDLFPSLPESSSIGEAKDKTPWTFLPERPERVLRSVSDIPKSSSMNGWKKYLVDNDNPQVKGITDISQWLNQQQQHHQQEDDSTNLPTEPPRRTSFREMTTPKQDFKLYEKSAAWLQEEFKRRTTMKQEINAAILARSDLRKEDHEIPTEGSLRMLEEEDSGSLGGGIETSFSTIPSNDMATAPPPDDAFAKALTQALRALPQKSSSRSSMFTSRGEISQQSEDDEVAALTTMFNNNNNNKSSSLHQPSLERLRTIPSDEEGAPAPRRLMFGSSSIEQRSSSSAVPGVPPPPQLPTNGSAMMDIRQDMLRFSNDTRNLLHGPTHEQQDPSKNFMTSDTRLHWMNDSNAMRDVESSPMEVPGVLTATLHRPTISAMTDEGSNASPYDPFETPPLVESLDSYLGISKGDITLSLLNEDHSTSAKSTWANRVRVAIWRARRMRKSGTTAGVGGGMSSAGGSSDNNRSNGGAFLHRRTSLPVDIDTARVAGGVRSVKASQTSALSHLRNDRIDEALEFFEDIIFAYYDYFDRCLKAREANPGGPHHHHHHHSTTTDFRPYIGAALHNLGILNLLKGDYNQALSYFGRAVENRKGCLGQSHSDHVASLVKVATCHYAVNEFAEAHAKLEEALEYARTDAKRIDDRMQMAEILNNLGCLAYMCGQPAAASSFFRESMDVQFHLMGRSLYLCSADVGQSISLNLSITRANIGFIKLVTNQLPLAVTALENALMEQQLLLIGANASLLATMDHLAVANLLNGESDKAAMMYGRIYEIQRREYGAQDSSCFVTMDKINMVKSSGIKFEEAVAELRKTFSLPDAETHPTSTHAHPERDMDGQPTKSSGGLTPPKVKASKNKVMKVLTSIRKKK